MSINLLITMPSKLQHNFAPWELHPICHIRGFPYHHQTQGRSTVNHNPKSLLGTSKSIQRQGIDVVTLHHRQFINTLYNNNKCIYSHVSPLSPLPHQPVGDIAHWRTSVHGGPLDIPRKICCRRGPTWEWGIPPQACFVVHSQNPFN